MNMVCKVEGMGGIQLSIYTRVYCGPEEYACVVSGLGRED